MSASDRRVVAVHPTASGPTIESPRGRGRVVGWALDAGGTSRPVVRWSTGEVEQLDDLMAVAE